MRKQRGITLIALVLTIIILLILAGVSIANLTGDNGLLTKAETAVQSNKDSQELEKIKLAVVAAQVEGEGKLNTTNLKNELEVNLNDSDIDNNLKAISNYWNYKGYKIDNDGNVEKWLPAEYQQVEYIESSVTQYIDTGYYSSSNEEIELTVSFNNLPVGGFSFFGGKEVADAIFYDFWYVSGVNQLQYYASKTSSPRWTQLDARVSTNTIYKLKSVLNNGIYTAYYNDISLGTVTDISDNISTKSLWLFADYSSTYKKMRGKCYECIIKSNGIINRNFIPCKRNSDNKPGLYDLVKGKFYTNQGTGDFIAGPEV